MRGYIRRCTVQESIAWHDARRIKQLRRDLATIKEEDQITVLSKKDEESLKEAIRLATEVVAERDYLREQVERLKRRIAFMEARTPPAPKVKKKVTPVCTCGGEEDGLHSRWCPVREAWDKESL